MSTDSSSLDYSFVPEEPLDPRGDAFFKQLSGMLDGQEKEPAAVDAAFSDWSGILEKIAGDLYRISSMLLGEGEEAVGLIESVVTELDIANCADPLDARRQSRLLLGARAIASLAGRDPAAFEAPQEGSAPVSCIEDDDLDAAGVSSSELERMLEGPDSQRLRGWLEGLPVSLRAIFVLRAVAGLNSGEIAGLIAENGGAAASDWTPEAVRSSFRQALCSLASQLLHATTAR
jgi:hypothetical protein